MCKLDKLLKFEQIASIGQISMIVGPHDVLPVRQTASTSGNALWRHVGRISVGGVLLAGLTVSVAFSADATKDEWTIRIVPATKSRSAPPFPRFAPPAPMTDQMSRDRMMRQPATVPPPPAAEVPAQTAKAKAPAHPSPTHHAGTSQAKTQQPRIIPSARAHVAPNAVRYHQIYRSIPYSRTAYEYDPMYRQELALSLLLNQFPPAPTIVAPGSGGMGNQGPMSSHRGGHRFGSPMNYGAPMPMPGFMPEF
jgi:hypothetical protein